MKYQFRQAMKVLGRHFAADSIVAADEIDAGCLAAMLANQQIVPIAEVSAPVPAPAELDPSSAARRRTQRAVRSN